MFRRIFSRPLFLNRLFKTSLFTYTLFNISNNLIVKKYQNPHCFTFKGDDSVDPINSLLSQVVKVAVDGDTLGYAFCIEENILVTVSPALVDKRKDRKKMEFYFRDQNIHAEYQVLGHFENLTFIKIKKADKTLHPMPAIKAYQKLPITPVQVIQKRSFLSIKSGYIVTKSSGYGIVDGKGQVGSLVIANNGASANAAGIVTQIGRDSQIGFMRMVAWGDLINVLRRIQKQQLYLGLSAAALQDRDGLAIARVAPNSPFTNKLQMGDIIMRVNNQTILHSDDLKRIIMFSGQQTVMEVERDGHKMEVIVEI